LNPDQRTLIRDIHDERIIHDADLTEMYDLFEQGYVSVVLTEKGHKAYEKIMKSGDGPEHLKEMFRI
jgi:hypothetical protein